MRFPEGYQVLRVRDYRLFWTGQWISLVGTWMQSATQAWLLTRLTDSAFALGLLGAASSAPFLLFVLPGGLLSDTVNRRRLIMITQTLSMLQAAVLSILTLSGLVQPWHIIALAALLGSVNAFDIPARQAFIIELVGVDHLPNAIALNSSAFNVARVVGPAIAGFLVAAVGEGICFLLNAVSYLAVLYGLMSIAPCGRDAAQRAAARRPGALLAGVRYALRRREVALVLGLVGAVSMIAVPYRAFLPAMARHVLDVGAWRYGLLLSAAGVGAGAGGIILAGLRLRTDRYRRLLPLGLFVFCAAMTGFALSTQYMLSLLLLAAAGAGGIIYFNASNTMVQLSVDDEHRGRVMSLYSLMHQGTASIGSLALGTAASLYGTPVALLGGALVACAALLAYLAASPQPQAAKA
jgi:MFS family permease